MAKLNKRNAFSQRRRKFRALGDAGPRFTLSLGPQFSQESDYRLVLPFRRSRIGIVLSGLFLAGFAFPLVGIVGEFFGGLDDSLFSFVALLFAFFWGLGWSVAVVILAILFLLLSFGRETLEVRKAELVLRIGVPLVGFGAVFPATYIRNFRTESPQESTGSEWRGEHLAFDFAGENIGFGSAISPEQSRQVLAELVRLFPQQAEAPEQLPSPDQDEEETGNSPAPADAAAPQQAPLHWHSLSSLALIAANLVPLAGVIWLGWNVGEVMLLFWAESAVIGFYNVMKMVKISGWSTLLYGPFFVGHYGAFMAGHLLFIYGFFGENFADGADVGLSQLLADFVALAPALFAFVISHGVSYFTNFLPRQEYRHRSVSEQMGQPYKRIVIMHLTIIFGGFLVMLFETALPALLLLIFLKVGADLRGHLREHGGQPNE